jgi:hypothetical protein
MAAAAVFADVHNRLLVQGWSQWQPYIRSGDKRRGSQNKASLFTVKELKAGGHDATPDQFGIYAIGILPPDIDVKHMAATNVIIVNVGIAGDAPPSKNTLKGRLRSYQTKVKPYEWALARWLECGFSVWVKWKVIQSDDEKGLATIRGAKLRKDAETEILKTYAFFLNTAEQKQVKGKGGSLHRNPDALPMPLLAGRTQTHAGDFAPAPPVTLAEVKSELQAMLRARDATVMRAGLAQLLSRLP